MVLLWTNSCTRRSTANVRDMYTYLKSSLHHNNTGSTHDKSALNANDKPKLKITEDISLTVKTSRVTRSITFKTIIIKLLLLDTYEKQYRSNQITILANNQ